MANDLKNLLSFKNFNMDEFNKKQGKKSTKRTDTGLDVINEHHIEDTEERRQYIIDNIDQLDDEWVEILYLEIEKAQGVSDEEDIEDIEDELEDELEDVEEEDELEDVEEEDELEDVEDELEDVETEVKVKKFNELEDLED